MKILKKWKRVPKDGLTEGSSLHSPQISITVSILPLPDEIFLDIIENHLPIHDLTTTLYNLNLVCKRLRILSIHRLYRRVGLYDNAPIYLFLRSMVYNPHLSKLVQEISLQWMYQNGTEYGISLDKYSRSRSDQVRRIYPPKDEIERIHKHAIDHGLEEWAQHVRASTEIAIQIRVISLLLSLPHLQSLKLLQDHMLPQFDELFLKLAQWRQGQNQFLPNLTTFEREYSDVFTDYFSQYSPIAMSHIVPALLVPCIQTVTVSYALSRYAAEKSFDLHDLLINKSLRHSSSVHTLCIQSCQIHHEELELLLQFPRNLRSLQISPWSDSDTRQHEQVSLNLTLTAIRSHISHSLETLQISTWGWEMGHYSPIGIFSELVRLKRLSTHIKVLLEADLTTLGDIHNLLPPSVAGK